MENQDLNISIHILVYDSSRIRLRARLDRLKFELMQNSLYIVISFYLSVQAYAYQEAFM